MFLNRLGELARSAIFLAVALFLLASRANGQIVELSPHVQELPKNDPNVYYKSIRWFSVPAYKGVVTWKITGADVGFQETDEKPLTLTTFTGGGEDLSTVTIPPQSAMVWGKKAKGNFTLLAQGVNDKGKIVELGTLSLYSTGGDGGGQPIPPVIPTRYQTALDLDKVGLPDYANWKSTLAEAYKLQAGGLTPMTGSSFASIINKLNEASVNTNGVKRLVNVRKAIGEDFGKILPTDGNVNIDVDKVRALLLESAATLEGLK